MGADKYFMLPFMRKKFRRTGLQRFYAILRTAHFFKIGWNQNVSMLSHDFHRCFIVIDYGRTMTYLVLNISKQLYRDVGNTSNLRGTTLGGHVYLKK